MAVFSSVGRVLTNDQRLTELSLLHISNTIIIIKRAIIIAVMNAIEAIAYRSLKMSGLQRGLNP